LGYHEPDKSHVLCGVPVWQFSATMGLGGEVQFCASAGRTPVSSMQEHTNTHSPSRRLVDALIYTPIGSDFLEIENLGDVREF